MKLHAIPLSLLLTAITSSAVILPFKQGRRSNIQRRSGGASVSVSKTSSKALSNVAVMATTSGSSSSDDDNALDLSSVHDLIYMSNVTVGDTVYVVQLDTGSSDLWIKGSTTPLPNSKDTSTTYNLTYGIGWAYGNVTYAAVEFAGINISSQALLDVKSATNPALSYGADGVLGLGFTSLSTIDALVNASDSSTGRSLLFNLFQDNPSEPNFIAFALQRTTDSEDDIQGSFSIGEYEEAYAAVENNTAISTWPVNSPTRWNVLLEAVIVGNTTVIPTTTVSGAPSNRAVALLDSGTSYTYAPSEVVDAIYGGVSGASYSSSLGQWIVPCESEIDMALQFGGQLFPMHPLDVSPASLTDSSTCVGSFIPQSVSVGAGEFDWLIGDNFLRSVYSIYDFGDFDSSGNMGNPFIKLLSLVDPDKASVEFHDSRGGTASTNITYNVSTDNSSSDSSTSVTLSTDVANTLDKIGKYFPAMLGVMVLNAAVLLGLVVIGSIFLCKGCRSSRNSTARVGRGRMSPMPMHPRNSYVGGPSPQPHTYEPVSMALTEDTLFAPPTPAFHNFDGTTLRPGDRPKSVA